MLEMWETDHGYGGPGDARTKLVCVFTSLEKAQKWLEKRGFTVLKYGRYSNGKGGARALDYELRPKSDLIDPL